MCIRDSAITTDGKFPLLAEQGDIALLTNADSAFESFASEQEDLLWQSAEGSGFSETTRTPTRITTEGGLQILAGDQVIAEYVPTGGDFEAGIEQLAQSPGLAWMAELQELDNVAWQEAQVAFDEWDYESQGLTEAGALLVSTVASFATSGLTSGLAGSISQGLGITNAGMQAAFQAGLSNLVSTASVSLVNNQGDLGAVLDELGSSQNLRSLVSSMVSAGLSSQLTEAMGAGAALPNGGSLMDKTLAGLQADLVQTSVSVVVDTAIQGGDLSENLVAGWSNAMVMAGLGAVQERIGDFAAENDIPKGTLPHVLAHAVAGGFAAQALGEDFADGALGAASAALTSNLVGESALSEGRQIELQNLIAMSATLLASDGDASAAGLAGSIGASTHEHNYLNHAEAVEMGAALDKLEECDRSGECSAAEMAAYQQTYAKLLLLDQSRDNALDLACRRNAGSAACAVELAKLESAYLSYEEAVSGYGNGFADGILDENIDALTEYYSPDNGVAHLYSKYKYEYFRNSYSDAIKSMPVDAATGLVELGKITASAALGDETAQQQLSVIGAAMWSAIKDPYGTVKAGFEAIDAQLDEAARLEAAGDWQAASEIYGQVWAEYAYAVAGVGTGGASVGVLWGLRLPHSPGRWLVKPS